MYFRGRPVRHLWLLQRRLRFYRLERETPLLVRRIADFERAQRVR